MLHKWYRNKKNLQYKVNYNYDYYFYHYYYIHLFGSLVKHGKKLWAFNFLVKTRLSLKMNQEVSPHILFLLIFSKISPLVILYPLKLGGIIYRVPRPIGLRKQKILAMRWLIKGLKDQSKTRNISLDQFLVTLTLSLSGKGPVIEAKKADYLYTETNRYLIRRFKR